MGGTGGGLAEGGTSAAGADLGGAGGMPDTSMAGAAGGGGAPAIAPKFGAGTTAKIMVIGSSNEIGTCWRAFLWEKLHTEGIENFDFVGGVTQGPECAVPDYDRDLQAENGNVVSNWTEMEVGGWFQTHEPDVLLLHVAGADVLQALSLDGVMASFTMALAEARAVSPGVEFMIGQHTPMEPAEEGTLALNAAIATWAAENTTAESPVTAVDLYTGLDTETDTSDGVHLTDTGSDKVADRFLSVLQPLFSP
jgi:hypothetical protein